MVHPDVFHGWTVDYQQDVLGEEKGVEINDDHIAMITMKEDGRSILALEVSPYSTG